MQQNKRKSKDRYPELEFRSIDRARGRARRYHLARGRTLFGESAILITWGRIGRPARVRVETFSTETKLRTRWRELLARRRAHGYREHLCA
jgi:predicted DNA-binding WGR domain protein